VEEMKKIEKERRFSASIFPGKKRGADDLYLTAEQPR
jgi:hypothetical protein